IGLTKTAAGEVARQGIRVNAVCPGPVDTRMIHSLEEQLNPSDPAMVGRRYQSAIPMGRYVVPDEIANTVLFLCSDLAAAITGAQYVVEGGRPATGGAVTKGVHRGWDGAGLKSCRSRRALPIASGSAAAHSACRHGRKADRAARRCVRISAATP